MSIIIALKNKDGIIVGADKQITCMGNSFHTANKIKQFKYSNIIIGTVGYLRDSQIIEKQEEIINWEDIVKKIHINYNYIIDKFIFNIYNIFKSENRIRTEDNIDSFNSDFLIATNEGLFIIENDMSIIECENFATIGSGLELVNGYLNTLNNFSEMTMKECENILHIAIKKSCKNNIGIDENIDILKTYKK